MATSKLKLAVDTGEWEGGLRQAIRSMDNFVQSAGGIDAALKSDSDSLSRFASMLGDMQSSAGTAAGRVTDLEKSIVELRMKYKELTDEEKASPFGQAMKESIDKLQVKLDENKTNLKEVRREMGETSEKSGGLGDAVNALSEKFGLSVKSLAGFATAGVAVTSALNVAKDAFFSNEEQLDSWGRTTETCESLYQGFLDALNFGGIHGYLRTIDDIVDAARDAYDALDELGTFNAFNQANMVKFRNNVEQEILEFKEGTGSKEDVRKAGNEYINELEERKKREQAAYEGKLKELAAKRGVSYDLLKKIFDGSYGDYLKLKNVQPTGTTTSYQPSQNAFTMASYTELKTKTPKNDRERAAAALRRINDTEIDEVQKLHTQVYVTEQEITRTNQRIERSTRTGSGHSTRTGSGHSTRTGSTTHRPAPIPTRTYEGQVDKEQYLHLDDVSGKDFTSAHLGLSSNQLLGYQKQIRDMESEIKNLEGLKVDFPVISDQIDKEIKAIQTNIKEKKLNVVVDSDVLEESVSNSIKTFKDGFNLSPLPLESSKELTKSAKVNKEAWQSAAASITNAVKALSSIGNKDLNVAGIIMQAVANIALGFAMATASPATGAAGVFGWIAAATAGLATMTATIASVKNATKKADGGLIQGNGFVGDTIPIMANAGEIVLNKSQQINIASQLQESESGGGIITMRQRGEDLISTINAAALRMGKGKLLFG